MREESQLQAASSESPTLRNTPCERSKSRGVFDTAYELTAEIGRFEVQRRRAVEALRLAAVEFRKLEELTERRR